VNLATAKKSAVRAALAAAWQNVMIGNKKQP